MLYPEVKVLTEVRSKKEVKPFKKTNQPATKALTTTQRKTEGMHVQVFFNTWQESRERHREGPFLTLPNFSQS